MSRRGYAVGAAQIDEIDEIDDGAASFRAPSGFTWASHFFFGVKTRFQLHQVGDRLINEHDKSQEHDLQEELYLVQRGRATFELDGKRVDAPAGTLVFARPAVKQGTAFAEGRRGRRSLRSAELRGRRTEARGGEI